MVQQDLKSQRVHKPRWINRPPACYLVTTLFVAIAAVVRLTVFADLGSHMPYVTFFPAVLLAALIGGFGSGMLGGVLAITVMLLWRSPQDPPLLHNLHAQMGAAIFLATSAMIGWVCAALHSARARALASEFRVHLAEERKRALEGLRASEARFRILADANMIGIVTADSRDHRIVEANDYYLNLLGVSREELNAGAIRWPDFTPPEYLEMERRQVDEARQNGTITKPYEKEYLRRDGRRVPILLGVAPLESERDRVGAFVLDLTELKRAQHERDITLQFLQLINQSASRRDLAQAAVAFMQQRSGCESVGIRLQEGEDYPYYETRGFPQTFIQTENQLCTRDANGEPIRDSQGNPLLECMCGNIICRRFDASKPFFTPGGSFWTNSTMEWLATTTEAESQNETRNTCAKRGYESLALIPLRVGEEQLGLLQLNDRRKGMFSLEMIGLWERLAGYLAVALAKCRAEEALREANAQLAETDRRKDEFLAMLAHELRNPLAPMRHAISILQSAELREAPAAHLHDTIERQVNHMARLVDDLLDVSRVTRGKIDLRRQPLILARVLQHAIETVTPLLRERRQRLDFDPPSGALVIDGDEIRLIQAIGNLLLNAVKFTPEEGRIWLETTCEDGHVVIRVRDTGVGIAPEMLHRIFDLFVQVDSTRSRYHGGLGIGLTMVRKLVALHGGTVAAHSPGVGHGSEFILQLPLLDAAALDGWGVEPAPAEPAATLAMPARRVLIVDDVADSAASLAELLESWGHVTCTAFDGPAALELIGAFRPEVVLLDLGMPEMDGLEVAGRLRQMPEAEGITLVALTGYGQLQDIEATREAGFDHHMIKPVDLALLREVLGRN